MKQDVGDLPPIPRRRSQLARALDLHLAMWLDLDLTDSDRRRIENERTRRRLQAKTVECKVGILVGYEGMTPEQGIRLLTVLGRLTPSEISHTRLPKGVHGACKALGVPMTEHRDVRDIGLAMREVIRNSDTVIAMPKESREPNQKQGTGVWEMVKYAKHRSLPVTVIAQDGSIQQGEDDG